MKHALTQMQYRFAVKYETLTTVNLHNKKPLLNYKSRGYKFGYIKDINENEYFIIFISCICFSEIYIYMYIYIIYFYSLNNGKKYLFKEAISFILLLSPGGIKLKLEE